MLHAHHLLRSPLGRRLHRTQNVPDPSPTQQNCEHLCAIRLPRSRSHFSLALLCTGRQRGRSRSRTGQPTRTCAAAGPLAQDPPAAIFRGGGVSWQICVTHPGRRAARLRPRLPLRLVLYAADEHDPPRMDGVDQHVKRRSGPFPPQAVRDRDQHHRAERTTRALCELVRDGGLDNIRTPRPPAVTNSTISTPWISPAG